MSRRVPEVTGVRYDCHQAAPRLQTIFFFCPRNHPYPDGWATKHLKILLLVMDPWLRVIQTSHSYVIGGAQTWFCMSLSLSLSLSRLRRAPRKAPSLCIINCALAARRLSSLFSISASHIVCVPRDLTATVNRQGSCSRAQFGLALPML